MNPSTKQKTGALRPVFSLALNPLYYLLSGGFDMRTVCICLLLSLFVQSTAIAESFTWTPRQLNVQNGEIRIKENGFFSPNFLGSAFVFGKSNYVVTCYHVWYDATNFYHTTNLYFFSDARYDLTPKCFFPTNDIAVFTTTPIADTKPFVLGNISAVRPNDTVAFCGSNHEYNKKFISAGTVVHCGFESVGNTPVFCFDFSGDDAIPGYSGGGVFNFKGEIIGIFCEIGHNPKQFNRAKSIEVLRPLLTN